ncbi:MAG: CaiB/BaiF CoA transferase family protein [Acidimicrobiales bacterium]
MLSYRVLDLTDERGQLCGKLLADLGADVVLVEPPGGSSSRALGPFAGNQAGPDRSLYHWAFNRGKRSVVVDLHREEGRAALLQMVREADLLVESFNPGVLDGLGLGHDVLARANPRLVHAAITAFGSDGPKAHWPATDLTLAAASGYSSLTGDSDRAPLRVTVPQVFHHAAGDAAGAALVALYERDHHSGLGQFIDISAQQSHSVCSQSFLLCHPGHAGAASREAGGIRLAGLDTKVQLLWPCRDGQVSVTFLFGVSMGPFTRNLMEWIHEEGFCDQATLDKDWIDYATMLYDGREPMAEYERIKLIVADFLATKTKAELYQATFTRRLLIAPVVTMAELLASGHFAEREFWHDADAGPFGTVRTAGAFAKFSAAPLPNTPIATAIGPDVSAAAGSGGDRIWARPHVPSGGTIPKPTATPTPTGPARPLEGLKICDFMWVFAGPYCSRMLADLGATVIRIESSRRQDTLRTAGNFQDNKIHPDWNMQFTNVNAGKRSIALDLSTPAGREVALDLVRWADITMESFTPKAMTGFGFDYESLRVHKPDLIMTSSCLMGHYGPESSLAGFGTMAAAISGWFHVTGWPDRLPGGPFSAYTDYVSPRFLLLAVFAALEHRRRTGQGQYIDLSQAEASLQFMGQSVLEYTVNGTVVERAGNDDAVFAPHGTYRARGTEEWVAIAVTGEEPWRALCDVLQRPDLAELTIEQRRAGRRDLDQIIEGWTSGLSAAQVQHRLIARGIAAHQVQNTVEAFNDPQLAHRGHFVQVPHGAMGKTWVEGSRYRLSRTPAVVGAPPTLGQHNWEVLTEVLGYDDDRAADLAAAGAFE